MLAKGLPMLPSSRIPAPPAAPPAPFQLDDLMAVEILREFGASELIGRLYSRPEGGSWSPVQPPHLHVLPWYEVYTRDPQLVVFDLQASGPWEVPFVRRESDEQGIYTAVALKRMEKAPAWFVMLRKVSAKRQGFKI